MNIIIILPGKDKKTPHARIMLLACLLREKTQPLTTIYNFSFEAQ